MRRITICTDEDGYEAMYVDGVLEMSDNTIYASDIAAQVTKGESIQFEHISLAAEIDVWPRTMAELLGKTR